MEKPNTKVQAGGLSGGLAAIVLYILGSLGVEIPAEVAVAITTVVVFIVQYFVPEKASA